MLKADSLCKAHDAEPLFTDASFTLGNDERAGLVGLLVEDPAEAVIALDRLLAPSP